MKRSFSKLIVIGLLVSVFAAVTMCCCSSKLLQSLHSAKACSHCPKGTSHTPDGACLSKLSLADLFKNFSFSSIQEKTTQLASYLLFAVIVLCTPQLVISRLDGSPRLLSVPLYIQSHNLRL